MNQPASELKRKLGYYLMGLAIGCVMLGVIWQWKAANARRAQAAGQAATTPEAAKPAAPAPAAK